MSFVPSVRSAKFLQIETTHQLTFPRSLRNSQSLCSHFCTLFCLISPVFQRFTLQPTRTPTHTLAHLFPPRSPVPPPPPLPSKHPWGVCHPAYSTGPPVTMEEAVARACALTKAAEDRAVELQAWLEGHELEEIYVSLAVNGFNSLRRVQKMSREDMEVIGLSRGASRELEVLIGPDAAGGTATAAVGGQPRMDLFAPPAASTASVSLKAPACAARPPPIALQRVVPRSLGRACSPQNTFTHHSLWSCAPPHPHYSRLWSCSPPSLILRTCSLTHP